MTWREVLPMVLLTFAAALIVVAVQLWFGAPAAFLAAGVALIALVVTTRWEEG